MDPTGSHVLFDGDVQEARPGLALGLLCGDSRVNLVGVTGSTNTDSTRRVLEKLGRTAPTPAADRAHGFIVESIEKHRGDLTILCAASPRRIANALSDRDSARGLARLVVVGGAWAPGPVLPWVRAEPNFGESPDAARALMRAPCPRIVIPAALSRKIPLTAHDAERHIALRSGANLDAAGRIRRLLIPAFLRRRLHAPALLGAAYLLAPHAFEEQTLNLAVVGKGFLDQQPDVGPSQVVTALNTELFWSLYWQKFAALAGFRTER